MDLSKESLERIEKVIGQYPEKRSAVLPLLHIVQEEKGFVCGDAMEWIAGKLGLEPINVYELVTFYPMLKQEKVGRCHIKVCRTLSCALKGGYTVCDQLQEALGCGLGETTADGNYTIEFVECLASCGTAPVVQLNETLHENVTVEKVPQLLEEIKKTVELKRNW